MKKIGILGGGVWGSALAKLLSSSRVYIFARDEKIVHSINEHKLNPKLKYAVFNDNVTSTSDLTKFTKTRLPHNNITFSKYKRSFKKILYEE